MFFWAHLTCALFYCSSVNKGEENVATADEDERELFLVTFTL